MAITLKCWSCGKKQAVESPKPQLGVDLAKAALSAGMHPVHDSRYGRMLVFCSEECIKEQTTKTGHIRRHPKSVLVTQS